MTIFDYLKQQNIQAPLQDLFLGASESSIAGMLQSYAEAYHEEKKRIVLKEQHKRTRYAAIELIQRKAEENYLADGINADELIRDIHNLKQP